MKNQNGNNDKKPFLYSNYYYELSFLKGSDSPNTFQHIKIT